MPGLSALASASPFCLVHGRDDTGAGMKKAIALLLLIFSELSGAMDGNTLLKACTDEDHSNDKAICMGYVVAVADALNVGIGGSKACFPNGLTYGQLVDVAKKSLRRRVKIT
jgi:hypothetical protein